MPAELRTLTFSKCDLRTIALKFFRKKGFEIRDADVLDLHLDRNSKSITLEFRRNKTDHRLDEGASVTGRDLLAAILLYCREARIPVPREAQKRFSVSKDNSELHFHIKLPQYCPTQKLCLQTDGGYRVGGVCATGALTLSELDDLIAGL